MSASESEKPAPKAQSIHCQRKVRTYSTLPSVGRLKFKTIRHSNFQEADFSVLIRVSVSALGKASPRSSERRRRTPSCFSQSFVVFIGLLALFVNM